MFDAVGAVRDREAEVARLEGEIAEVCGVLNAATGRLVDLIATVLATDAWTGAGIRSPNTGWPGNAACPPPGPGPWSPWPTDSPTSPKPPPPSEPAKSPKTKPK